ncbi:MAG: hypothetical protein RIK87_02620 [Fuerstiella sp.]
MQTFFPKIATILLAISAVAFMGLSIAAYYGRPDPISEMLAPEVKNYQFKAAAGETTTWEVTPIVGENRSPKQHPNAYAAIADAYRMEGQRLGGLTTQWSDLATQLREQITSIRTRQQLDADALKQRIDTLSQLVSNAEANLQNLSKQLQAVTVDTTIVRDDTTKRRQDVMRLQNELEELRTDKFRLEEIRRVLSDRLLRLQLENQSLDQRLSQMNNLASQ